MTDCRPCPLIRTLPPVNDSTPQPHEAPQRGASAPSRPSGWSGARIVAVTLTVGAIGGFLTNAMGLPAAWLSGAMIAVAIASLSGLRTHVPNWLRDVVFLFLGISIGSGVSPETLQSIVTWPLSMVALGFCVASITAAIMLYLHKVMGWDRATSFLSGLPGALSYVVAVAMETGADVRRVAISQSMRLFLLVAIMPSLIVWLEGDRLGGAARVVETVGIMDGLLLLGTGLAGGLALKFLKVPAGLLVGGLIASASLHLTGIVSTALPMWVLVPGLVAMGGSIGARFNGSSWTEMASIAVVSVVAITIGIVVSVAFAALVAFGLDLPFGQTLLAFAPGGVEVMTIMAFAMDMDPAYVAAHQISRFLAMALIVPWAILFMLEPEQRAARMAARQGRGTGRG